MISILIEFLEAIRRGDRSWWPFIVSVVALIAVGVVVATMLS